MKINEANSNEINEEALQVQKATPVMSFDRNNPQLRKFTRNYTKNKSRLITQLRIDSPRTQQACFELGYAIDEVNPYNQKQLNDFVMEGQDEKLAEVKFEHYQQRYERSIKEIYEKRRQIIEKQKHIQQFLNQNEAALFNQQATRHTHTYTTDSALLNNNISIVSPQQVQLQNSSINRSLFFTSPNNQSYNSSTNKLEKAQSGYKKAVAYLRNSHKNPNIKASEDVLFGDTGLKGSHYNFDLQNPCNDINFQMEEELEKFNRQKIQSQKEARLIYFEEQKRLKMLAGMQHKEENVWKVKKQIQQEKQKVKLQSMEEAKRKQEKIREIEERFEREKDRQKAQIRERLKKMKLKQQRDKEAKEQLLKEQELKFQRRVQEVLHKKSSMQQYEIENSQDQLLNIQLKQKESSLNYQQNLLYKTKMIQQQLDQLQQQINKQKEMRESIDQQHVSQFVEKNIEIDNNKKARQKQQKLEKMQHLKELNKKHKALEKNRKDMHSLAKHKTMVFSQKQQQLHQLLEEKLKEEKLQKKIQKAKMKLRQEDLQQNNHRLWQIHQNKLNKLLEKERWYAHKLQDAKQQKNILNKTKSEVALASKLEKERIYNGITQVQNILEQSKVSKNGNLISKKENDKSLLILKSIIKGSDEEFSLKEKNEANASNKNGGNTQSLTQGGIGVNINASITPKTHR